MTICVDFIDHLLEGWILIKLYKNTNCGEKSNLKGEALYKKPYRVWKSINHTCGEREIRLGDRNGRDMFIGWSL